MEKKIRIKKIKLKNFKKFKEFKVDFGDRDLLLTGDNGVGKTTIFDAWSWLTTNADSLEQANFGIQPEDDNGNIIHGLETSVEADIVAGGADLVLKKIFVEKMTKRRGEARKKVTGHTTTYLIDDHDVGMRAYQKKIDSIFLPGIIKVLSNPLYFNEGIKWPERWVILSKLCDTSNQDIIDSDPEFEDIPGLIAQWATNCVDPNDIDTFLIEESKKNLKKEIRKINKEITYIAVAIKEVNHGMPDITKLNPVEVECNIKKWQGNVAKKRLEKERAGSNHELVLLKNQLASIDNRIIRMQADIESELQKKEQEKKENIHRLETMLAEQTSLLKELEKDKNNTEKSLIALESEVNQLRADWHKLQSEEYVYDGISGICPTCGKPVTEEEEAAFKEDGVKKYNIDKAEKLKEISATGKKKAAEKKELDAQRKKLDIEIVAIENKKKTINDDLDAVKESKVIIEITPRQEEAQAEKDALINKINKLENGDIATMKQAIEEEIAEAEDALSVWQNHANAIQKVKEAKDRIEELNDDETVLGQRMDDIQKSLETVENFGRQRATLLQEEINSKFELVKWKLFDIRLNGEIQDMCTATFNGHEYKDLSKGESIRIGMDIIKTLQRHYECYPPLFVDNAEAVTVLPEMETQVIRLVKPTKILKKHKQLIIEEE